MRIVRLGQSGYAVLAKDGLDMDDEGGVAGKMVLPVEDSDDEDDGRDDIEEEGDGVLDESREDIGEMSKSLVRVDCGGDSGALNDISFAPANG